jgi:hypothetical protein
LAARWRSADSRQALAARAIQEEKNLETLVIEILEAAAKAKAVSRL